MRERSRWYESCKAPCDREDRAGGQQDEIGAGVDDGSAARRAKWRGPSCEDLSWTELRAWRCRVGSRGVAWRRAARGIARKRAFPGCQRTGRVRRRPLHGSGNNRWKLPLRRGCEPWRLRQVCRARTGAAGRRGFRSPPVCRAHHSLCLAIDLREGGCCDMSAAREYLRFSHRHLRQ